MYIHIFELLEAYLHDEPVEVVLLGGRVNAGVVWLDFARLPLLGLFNFAFPPAVYERVPVCPQFRPLKFIVRFLDFFPIQ